MLELTLETVGFKEASVKFERLSAALKDYRPVWPLVKAKFHEIELALFRSQGATGRTGKWKPLSPDYAKWKAEHFIGKTILQATGELRMSLTGIGDSDVVYTPMMFSERSTVWYGKFHAGGSKLPFRPPVSLTARDSAEIGIILRRYVFGVIRDNFGGTRGSGRGSIRAAEGESSRRIRLG